MASQISPSNSNITLPPMFRYIIENPDQTISASMPFDDVTVTRMCQILGDPKAIKELILTPPRRVANATRLHEEIGETVLWFLGKHRELRKLEHVVLPLEFHRSDFGVLFRNLRRLNGLKSLKLTLPLSYDYFNEAVYGALDEAIQEGIRSLTRLQEVTFPATMVIDSPGLHRILYHNFDGSVVSRDGSMIRYYKIV